MFLEHRRSNIDQGTIKDRGGELGKIGVCEDQPENRAFIRWFGVMLQYLFSCIMGSDQEKETVDVSDLENGPLTEANRECRDVLCCLLFVAAIGGMVYLGIYGFTKGDPTVIYRGVDQNGMACGVAGSVTASYPYLYFTNPISSVSMRACVNKCPAFTAGAVETITCYNGASLCNSNTYTATYNTSGSTVSGSYSSSGFLGYDTTLTLDRICIPNPNMFSTAFSTATTAFSSAMSQGKLADFINDVKNNWQYLLGSAGVAVLVSFVVMFFLRCCAGCIVWISLFAIMFLLIGLGLIFLYNAGYLGAASTVATYLGIPTINSSYNEPVGWTLIGVGCAFFIVILCCCNRIRLAVAICKSAGQFVGSVCTIVMVPVFQSILGFGLWVGALITMVYLVSSASFVVLSSSDYFTSISNYGDPELIRFYIFIFFTLWTNAFIGAMTIFIIASACCMWYYSHAPGNELSLPVWRSYKMVFRYHWGSLAFGSLLVAIIQFLQMIVELFKRQAGDKGGKCMQYVLRCIQCCLACVECIVKFINTQAYIQIALRGKNFCYAAKDGFMLVWSNPMRYAIVGGIGTIIMFLGKLLIATITAIIFYLVVTYISSVREKYSEPMIQVGLVAIIAYLIGLLFMSVYSIAMDTLLQCFIVDESNQKGKGKAKWAPADLADLMDTEENAKE